MAKAESQPSDASTQGHAGDVDLRARIQTERGPIAWSELVRHFARGVVVVIEPGIDLPDAAECLIRDDTTTFEGWAQSNQIRRASDDDARDWIVRQPQFDCVVTAPWVLVQELIES